MQSKRRGPNLLIVAAAVILLLSIPALGVLLFIDSDPKFQLGVVGAAAVAATTIGVGYALPMSRKTPSWEDFTAPAGFTFTVGESFDIPWTQPQDPCGMEDAPITNVLEGRVHGRRALYLEREDLAFVLIELRSNFPEVRIERRPSLVAGRELPVTVAGDADVVQKLLHDNMRRYLSRNPLECDVVGRFITTEVPPASPDTVVTTLHKHAKALAKLADEFPRALYESSPHGPRTQDRR